MREGHGESDLEIVLYLSHFWYNSKLYFGLGI